MLLCFCFVAFFSFLWWNVAVLWCCLLQNKRFGGFSAFTFSYCIFVRCKCLFWRSFILKVFFFFFVNVWVFWIYDFVFYILFYFTLFLPRLVREHKLGQARKPLWALQIYQTLLCIQLRVNGLVSRASFTGPLPSKAKSVEIYLESFRRLTSLVHIDGHRGIHYFLRFFCIF